MALRRNMCLNAKGNYKIAKEDILCYKILDEDCYGELHSPFTLFKIKTDVVMAAEGKTEIEKFRGVKRISRGYFHTFKVRKTAIERSFGSKSVYECVIPKGTKYWEGKCFNTVFGYASKKLIVKSKEPEKKVPMIDL